MNRSSLLSTALVVSFLLARRAQREPVEYGSRVKADIVVVFAKGTSQGEINRFLEETIVLGAVSESHRHRSGVSALVGCEVEAHPCYAVTFSATAGPVERREILAAVRAHPTAFRVFEDVAPKDLRLR